MPRSANLTLSKSRYLSGLQCPKRLWTETHARHLLPPIERATQARFDQGHEVGRLATELFPGGLTIDPGILRWDRVVADTQRALTQRRPLYEAAFRSRGAACRVDILVPAPENCWDVLEVKSSTGVKEVHLQDLSLQAEVLDGSGLEVRDFYVVHLDTSYVRRGELDIEALFRQVNVTDQVRDRQQAVEGNLLAMLEVLGQDSRPEVAVGRHCDEPYACPMKTECWSFLPEPNVFDLVRGRQMGFELLSAGIRGLAEIPETLDLDERQRIQSEAVRSGIPHVDRPAISQFLKKLEYPLSYFDVETIGPAIPLYDGSRPYQQVPFLFSNHRVEKPGDAVNHSAYLFTGEGDPRPDFLRAAQDSLGTRGSIVAYNASFESRILQESAAAVSPDLQERAATMSERFVDLLIPFKSFAYHHPHQSGSASLKAVLAPLTGMSYANLEIADGETASQEYLRVLSEPLDPVERATTLQHLEDYCSLDTEAMVAIVARLQDLVSDPD